MNNISTYVDSTYRLPQSRSSSDFVVELQENFECPAGTKCWITEVSLPATWKTTEVGLFENLYFMLYIGSDVLLRSSKVYLGNKVYFAEQLSFDMVAGMNNAVRHLNAGNYIFVYAYSSATRTVEIKVADGLDFKSKIPTDDELGIYVSNTWNGASDGHDVYDNTEPLSINYLLSNYVATSLLTTFTSSYLNFVPFRSVLLHCPELADYHYSSPSSYSSSIVRKILIDQQLGGIVNDAHGGVFHEDFIDCSNKNLKRLSFHITDTIN